MTGTSSRLVTDLGVMAPPGAAVTATDDRPMVVEASNEAATRLIDQAKHSIIREWIARPDTMWWRYVRTPADQTHFKTESSVASARTEFAGVVRASCLTATASRRATASRKT